MENFLIDLVIITETLAQLKDYTIACNLLLIACISPVSGQATWTSTYRLISTVTRARNPGEYTFDNNCA